MKIASIRYNQHLALCYPREPTGRNTPSGRFVPFRGRRGEKELIIFRKLFDKGYGIIRVASSPYEQRWGSGLAGAVRVLDRWAHTRRSPDQPEGNVGASNHRRSAREGQGALAYSGIAADAADVIGMCSGLWKMRGGVSFNARWSGEREVEGPQCLV